MMSTVSSEVRVPSEPEGAVLFTGPDGIGDFKVQVEEQYFVGHGSMSPEASSDTQYLYRAAPTCPHPPPKMARVGEIGWGVPKLSDNSLLKSGQQIMLKEFRQVAEDRHTHLYQSPYYPPPPSSQQSQNSKLVTGDVIESDENLSNKSSSSTIQPLCSN